MPKDESRRRVKERLRPYVKVSPPGVVLLNFSVFHHFFLQDHLACDLIDKLLTLDPSKR